MSEEYRVQLDIFSGPLDLLLYLIRRDELDIEDISVARIADQYVEYIKFLDHLDPNAAGEFLVMAATLAEIKSRALLPTPPLEKMDTEDDPRAVLVTKLLEYKRFKDAARALGTAADERAKRYIRKPAKLPKELDGVQLEQVQVWDLLKAFNRVMTSIGEGPKLHDVRYDETPIEEIAEEIVELLEHEGPSKFSTLFGELKTRSEIVGRFLALLELTRQRRVRFEQTALFDEIYLFLQIPVDDDEDDADSAPLVMRSAEIDSASAHTDEADDNHVAGVAAAEDEETE